MLGHNHVQNKTRKGWTILVGVVVFSLLLTACGSAAQKTYTIGVVNNNSLFDPAIEGFKAGLAESGYVEGKTVTYIYNGVKSDPKAIGDEIKNLLAQHVDMLYTPGNEAALPAKQAVAGTNIPVVFGPVTDPVGVGLAESIRHPGGNLTSVQSGSEIPKALEWLVRITPNAKRIYVPYNPDDEISVMILGGLDPVASQLKIELVPGKVHSVEEAVAAIASLPADVQAIFRMPSPTLDSRNNELSQAAIKRRLPMASGLPLDEAVLLTLASDFSTTGKQVARLAHQIRQGVKPADLPIETSEFTLTINLKTAQAIGLDIPDERLRQATKVIR